MRSIRLRTFLIVFGASLLPVLALWALFSVVAKPKVKKQLADQRVEAIEQLASLLERNTQDWIEELKTIADNPAFTNDVGRGDEMRVLQRLKYDQLVLLDTDGYIVESTLSTGHKIQEYAPAFVNSVKTGEINISEPFLDQDKSDIYFPCFVPIKQDGKVVNVIKVISSFDSQTGPLNSFKIQQRGDILLLDSDGRVLHSQQSRKKLQPYTTAATNKRMTRSKSGIFRSEGHEDQVFASTQVQPFGVETDRSWVLMSLVPVSAANYGLQEMDKDFTMVLLLAIFCSGFVSILLNNWFSKPLDTLAAFSTRAANGDFEKIPMAGLQEVDQCAEAFNAMLFKISNQQDYLEQEVEDRLDELHASLVTLQSSHNAIEDGLVIVDREGLIAEANNAFCQLFEVSRGELLDFNDFSGHLADWSGDSNEVHSLFDTLDFSSELVLQEELTHKSDHRRTLNVYSAPIIKENGICTGRLWVFKDLTTYRILEEELRQSQKMEAIGTLAGGVAHDFNNLLTALSGNLNLVMPMLKDSPQASEMLGTALGVCGRATGLVKQLLSFSRKSRVQKEWCDLRFIAKETEAILSHTLDPSISVSLDSASDLWSVDADHNQMQQIMMNLCVNARDAIGRDGNITISMKNSIRCAKSKGITSDDHSEYVVIEVSDDGAGMSMDVKKKIFDPFFTTKEQGKGTGLGLSTCYGIATLHHGWMEVDTEVGVGTTMRLVLPKGKFEPKLEEESRVTEIINFEPSDHTVLIADDEPAVRGIAEILLKRSGYNVVTANDGLEAYQIVDGRKGDVDLVLLDLTMPRMDGKESFKNISKWYPEIPVMICSGYLCDFGDFETEDGHIPVGFIQKPYPLDEMTEQIKIAISESRVSETTTALVS